MRIIKGFSYCPRSGLSSSCLLCYFKFFCGWKQKKNVFINSSLKGSERKTFSQACNKDSRLTWIIYFYRWFFLFLATLEHCLGIIQWNKVISRRNICVNTATLWNYGFSQSLILPSSVLIVFSPKAKSLDWKLNFPKTIFLSSGSRWLKMRNKTNSVLGKCERIS